MSFKAPSSREDRKKKKHISNAANETQIFPCITICPFFLACNVHVMQSNNHQYFTDNPLKQTFGFKFLTSCSSHLTAQFIKEKKLLHAAEQHLTCPSGCCLFKIWHHRMICWEMRCLQRRLCAVREETECLGWTCSWSKADDRVRGLRDTDERRHRERTSHLILHHHPRSLQFFFSVAKRAKLSITCRPALQLNEGQNEKTVSYRV